MKTSFSYRAQEWLADHVSWMQYPNIKPANKYTQEQSRTGYNFKTPMKLGKRLDLFLISLLILIFGCALLGITLLLLYVLFF